MDANVTCPPAQSEGSAVGLLLPVLLTKLPRLSSRKLDANVSGYLADLDFGKMFDRLIVGPTPYPWPMYEAFVDALVNAGVADADKRLFASGIPIRA